MNDNEKNGAENEGAEEKDIDTGAEEEGKEPEEQPVGEILKDQKEEPKNGIPEAVFLAEKKGRKEAEKQLKALQAEIDALKAGGEKDADIDSGDLESLAKKHNADPELVRKLADQIQARAVETVEKKLAERLSPLEQKERERKIDEAFQVNLSRALERMPEFKGVVNPAVIKSLSLLPENSKKTFSQLIEETYGRAVPGKRSPDAIRPGSRDTGEIDAERARKDPSYFQGIMDNPAAKTKYNEDMLKRVSKTL
jgi:hypothetical protein